MNSEDNINATYCELHHDIMQGCSYHWGHVLMSCFISGNLHSHITHVAVICVTLIGVNIYFGSLCTLHKKKCFETTFRYINKNEMWILGFFSLKHWENLTEFGRWLVRKFTAGGIWTHYLSIFKILATATLSSAADNMQQKCHENNWARSAEWREQWR